MHIFLLLVCTSIWLFEDTFSYEYHQVQGKCFELVYPLLPQLEHFQPYLQSLVKRRVLFPSRLFSKHKKHIALLQVGKSYQIGIDQLRYSLHGRQTNRKREFHPDLKVKRSHTVTKPLHDPTQPEFGVFIAVATLVFANHHQLAQQISLTSSFVMGYLAFKLKSFTKQRVGGQQSSQSHQKQNDSLKHPSLIGSLRQNSCQYCLLIDQYLDLISHQGQLDRLSLISPRIFSSY